MKTLTNTLKSIKQYSKAGLASLVLSLAAGCEMDSGTESTTPEPYEYIAIPGDYTNSNFEIVDPGNGARVDSWGYVVMGVGAKQGATIVLEVHTDKWYPQGEATICKNGSWSSGVSLGGTGEYNNHTIKATQYTSEGTQVSTVHGVVRTD